MTTATAIEGFRYYPGFLDAARQRALTESVMAVLTQAPAYHATMPKSGVAMSVAMSNAGRFGWYSDKEGGYRYIERHPFTGQPWPAIPDEILSIWDAVANYGVAPECCLINHYRAGGIDLAGRYGGIPPGWLEPEGSDAGNEAAIGRCLRARRRFASGLPWHRPRTLRQQPPHPRRRADQPHFAPRDAAVRGKLGN
jgi:hypothetical protein